MGIEGRVVIVTGGTSGIGEGCTRHFAEVGAKVVAASIQRDEGEALEKDLCDQGHDVRFVHTDVTDEPSVENLVKITVDAHGRIDGLMSNAGVLRMGMVTEFDEKIWDAVMGVNVKGNLYMAKHVIPVMERQDTGGVIVITTSVAAFIGFPQHSLYGASKAALDALVRCLAMDHAGKVRVVGICPGTIDTPMLASSCDGWDKPVEEIYADVAKKIPVRRMGQPIDVAKAAAFLLSDDAGFINASSIMLEGGTMALPPW